MARSLARSTEVFVSTLDNTLVGTDPENLFSIKVLDGYSFSQDVATQDVGVNEAGDTPVRGTQAFNTALNPVDVSFSTYVRVQTGTEDVQGSIVVDFVDCVERVLWGSAMGSAASWTEVIDTGGPAVNQVITQQDATSITFGLGSSNTNTLLPLTIYFKLENTTYVVTDFNVSSAEVDFSIDGIATINWTGFGSRVTESQSDHATLAAMTAGTDYKAVPATTTTTFLRNKLSGLSLVDNDDSNAFPTDSIDVGGVVGATIALGTVGTMTVDAFAGGRVRNTTSDPDEWATVISNTNDVLTVAAADVDLITTWSDSDVLELYTSLENAGTIYNIPITGATLTLENNFTYLTPEELAIVNLPLAGFSGNRVVSGSLTAYLNTGAQGSGGLLQDMLAKIEGSVTNSYAVTFSMGAASTATPRVDYILPTCQLAIPTTNVEDLISTEISFTSKPSTGGTGSFEATNELTVQYFA